MNMTELEKEMTAKLKELSYAFYVKGTSKDLREAFKGVKELIQKAEN